MNTFVEEAIEDVSDRKTGDIRFYLRCALCGEVIWASKPIRYLKAGIAAKNENKRIKYAIKWNQKWELVLRKTIKSIAGKYNICPICNRICCDKCFRIYADDDMCADCAEKFGE